MSHYAKLATIAVRLLATVLFLLGVMGLIYYCIGSLLGARPVSEYADSLFSGTVYALAGLITFAMSKPIGRLLARGIES